MEIVGKNIIAEKVPERWCSLVDFFARIVLNMFVSKHLKNVLRNTYDKGIDHKH
jgi:hypothetical protein